MKVLVVEDDQPTAQLLHKGLTRSGFVVDVCGDGLDGVELAASGHYGAIILDVALPSLDGWAALTEMRKRNVRSAVLMLTAREAVEARVKGLELGADDYLIKPFAFSELLARIRTLLRRITREPLSAMEFEGLRIEPGKQRVTRYGATIELTTKEFQLLSLLMEHRGEVLSKYFILEQVWDMNFDGESNALEVHVMRLRAKVDAPFERKIIHTARGRGYAVR